jgi:hypothetical protein
MKMAWDRFQLQALGSAAESLLCTCVRTWREIHDCVPQMEV